MDYTGLELHLAVPTNPDGWGDSVTEEQALTFAEQLRDVYLEIFPLLYPGASVAVRLVDETFSHNNQSYAIQLTDPASSPDLRDDEDWIWDCFVDCNYEAEPTISALKARLAE
ncbi:MAG: hypothetical protein JRD89_08805 [Deltaproteobacteria bacterium]|nr:hypothetical protein [Deltaproteobacteria bacterium]